MEIDELRRKLIQACYWYYVKAKPFMSDYKYDMAFKELEKREETEGTVDWSPTQRIYGSSEVCFTEDWMRKKGVWL